MSDDRWLSDGMAGRLKNLKTAKFRARGRLCLSSRIMFTRIARIGNNAFETLFMQQFSKLCVAEIIPTGTNNT